MCGNKQFAKNVNEPQPRGVRGIKRRGDPLGATALLATNCVAEAYMGIVGATKVRAWYSRSRS
jgi:hypothetical protein